MYKYILKSDTKTINIYNARKSHGDHGRNTRLKYELKEAIRYSEKVELQIMFCTAIVVKKGFLKTEKFVKAVCNCLIMTI